MPDILMWGRDKNSVKSRARISYNVNLTRPAADFWGAVEI